MYQYCSSLETPPSLPATTLAESCYRMMFRGCSNLTKLPALRALTLATKCYNSMFEMCSKIKLSTTQTDEFLIEYRIPFVGTGTDAYNALDFMFVLTGGTFKSTPTINTTYFTSNEVIDSPKPLLIERVVDDVDNYHFIIKNTSGQSQTVIFHITSDIVPSYELENGETLEINEDNAPREIYYAVMEWLDSSLVEDIYCFYDDTGYSTVVLEANNLW